METILVTGANRGIGLQLCKVFREAGWKVIATCRHPDSAADLQALAGDKLQILPLDVCAGRSVLALLAALKHQCIDVLVNNAGVMGGEHQSLQDSDYDAWLRTMEVNALSPHRVSSAVLPNLKQSRRPRIVTISSQMGSFGLDMGHAPYAYCTSKTAASRVMQIMAKDLREDGIVVCPLHPGWVRTDMGGPNAEISVEQSVQGLFTLITGLEMQHSGRFWTWEGKEHVW
jgi:NAD(P)-dependent dehydrogenase (short-subunit alcohol dehydrogenase family)